MDDDQLDDLKQFIANTVSQTEESLQGQITQLRSEVKEGFEGVGTAIEGINELSGERDTEVDKQLALLKQQLA